MKEKLCGLQCGFIFASSWHAHPSAEVGRWGRFQGTAPSQAPRTPYRTSEPPPPTHTHTAASRGGGLKCSHWSLEVQPVAT